MLEAVIFDMDGVLCELDHPARLAHLACLSGLSPEEIHAVIWDSGFEDLSDGGELSSAEYLAGFGERIGYALSESQWIACRKAGTIPMPECLRIAGGLREKLALLTNNGHLLKQTMSHVFPALPSLFGANIFVSAEFRARKPDPQIFLRVCEAINSDPANTLMVDDREENVLGARSAGLQAHLFTTPEELRYALCQLGLHA
jgi:HAD superfamily hydrolase (TIGR01509 family)